MRDSRFIPYAAAQRGLTIARYQLQAGGSYAHAQYTQVSSVIPLLPLQWSNSFGLLKGVRYKWTKLSLILLIYEVWQS